MIRLQLSNGWHQPNMCILALAIGQKWIHNQKIQRYYTNIVHPYLQRDAIMWIIQKYQENPRFVITIIKEASQMSSETSSGLHSTTDCLWVIQVEIPDDLDERVRSQSILIIRRGATFLFDFFCITALQCITLKQKKKKQPQTILMPPAARPQWRQIKTYFHLKRKLGRYSGIQRLFWPAGGRDGSLLRFESPKTLASRQLSLMSVVELRWAWPYQAATEHHTLSPPYLLPWLSNAQRLLFFSSYPTASHTQRVSQRPRRNTEVTTPPGPAHSALLPLSAGHLWLRALHPVYTCVFSKCAAVYASERNPEILNSDCPRVRS